MVRLCLIDALYTTRTGRLLFIGSAHLPITQEGGHKSSGEAEQSSSRTANWSSWQVPLAAPHLIVKAAVSGGDVPGTGSQEIWSAPKLQPRRGLNKSPGLINVQLMPSLCCRGTHYLPRHPSETSDLLPFISQARLSSWNTSPSVSIFLLFLGAKQKEPKDRVMAVFNFSASFRTQLISFSLQ